MKPSRGRKFERRVRAGWRDTLLLLREFRWPLLEFLGITLGAGCLYFLLARGTPEQVDSLPESIYQVLSLTFLQSLGDFPHEWYLQIFYFVMPILGVGILAQGLADFGVFLFNRRARGKEWQMAVASTFNNHVILIGLGHLGFRVVKQLHSMNQDVVVVEMDPKADLLAKVQALDIPVIQDDGTRETALEAAGIQRARGILLCTQNDSLNLQMAVKARSLNPQIQVVVRIFDEDFASALEEQFGFRAFSATGMAAPIFAASAANVEITAPINIGGQPNSLAHIKVDAHSHLSKQSVEAIENQYLLSIVALGRDGRQEPHPSGEHVILPGDTLTVLGTPQQINLLVYENQP